MTQEQTVQESTQVVDLDKRGAAYSTGKLDPRFVLELAKRYNIEPIERRSGDGLALSNFWFDLFFALAQKYVSAFKTKRRGGTPKKEHRQSGSVWPYAHEARLVQLVNYFRNKHRRLGRPYTRPTLFKEIAKHSKGYSWKYKDLRKTNSFTQEWKKIPSEVKENPSRFLPPRELPPYEGGLVPTHILQPEFERLQRVLPPISEA